ncbi:MAG: response regulator [Candidatus Krumholzibacteriota bacterium]
MPRRRSGSIRDRKIDVPGVDRDAHPLRILLVDDAPVNLAVGSRLLGRMGCQVDPATTGDYAMALFRDGCPEARYDLVLMDMNMPGMNGMEASRAIRELEAELPPEHPYRIRPVPILIVTSFNPGDRLDEFQRAGANDFLYKPFEPEVLREALSRWVPVHA